MAQQTLGPAASTNPDRPRPRKHEEHLTSHVTVATPFFTHHATIAD